MVKKALLIVDLQNDFCKGGALYVPNGDEVVPYANQLMSHFDIVIATKDWHPANHASFASNQPGHKVGDVVHLDGMSQVLWPDHCVIGSEGAKLHPQLNTSKLNRIITKGTNSEIDSYSAFFDNAHLQSTGLYNYLVSKDISVIYIMGLATDYCVKFSVLDALQLGLTVYIIEDACRGVNLRADDSEKALQEMDQAGAKRIMVSHLLATKG